MTAADVLAPFAWPAGRRREARQRWRIAVTVPTALWAGLWLVAGDGLAVVRLGLYISPFLLAGTGLCCLLCLAARAPATAVLHGTVALALLAAQPPALGRALVPAAVTPGTVTLTTLSNRTLNTDMAATAAVLRRHPADIFVLQEIAAPDRLLGLLAGLYEPGLRPAACRRGDHLIVSRHPIGAPHAQSDNIATFCPVELPAGRIWAGSVHLPRALLDDAAQSAAVEKILLVLDGLDAPVLLGGDFNATPPTTAVRRIGTRLDNAFDRAGSGVGFTFPTPARRIGRLGAFLRIDHIFASPLLRPVAARVEDWHPPLADHYPVTAVLQDLRGRP